MSTKAVITGFFGCYCHPFASFAECNATYKQKLSTGDKVRHRCKGTLGYINDNCPEKGFVIVKYGEKQCDLHLEHVQNLIKL